MSERQTVWGGSESDRRKLTGWFGLFAALGWVALELFFELLLGSHVRLVRSMAIGSGIGAGVGLLVSTLQWLASRGYLSDAGRLIPATTAASTLAGMGAGFLIYALNHNIELYRSSLPLQGVTGAAIVSLAVACAQWSLLRDLLAVGHGWRGWTGNSLAGSATAAVCALLTAAAIEDLSAALIERRLWPYMLIVAYLAASVVGGTVYGRFTTDGLRRALSAGTERAQAGADQGTHRPADQARPGTYARP